MKNYQSQKREAFSGSRFYRSKLTIFIYLWTYNLVHSSNIFPYFDAWVAVSSNRGLISTNLETEIIIKPKRTKLSPYPTPTQSFSWKKRKQNKWTMARSNFLYRTLEMEIQWPRSSRNGELTEVQSSHHGSLNQGLARIVESDHLTQDRWIERERSELFCGWDSHMEVQIWSVDYLICLWDPNRWLSLHKYIFLLIVLVQWEMIERDICLNFTENI